MKCEYNDGLKVDYGGSLRIAKGDEVNVYIKEGFIPKNIKGELSVATINNSCSAIRKVADTVTNTFGKKACIHE